MNKEIVAGKYIPLYASSKNPLTILQAMFWPWAEGDRFDILNKFHTFNFVTDNGEKHPLPTFKNTGKSLNDIMLETAAQYSKNYERMAVLWSGGVDSTGILAALIQANVSPDRLLIIHSSDSITEAPYEYEWLKKNGFQTKSFEWNAGFNSVFREVKDHELVVGWCADQLFGSIVGQNYPDQVLLSWRDGLAYILRSKERGYTAEDIHDACDLLKYYADKLNIKISTAAEALWLFNFGIKWSHVSRDLSMTVIDPEQMKHCHTFYENADFQDWSWFNYQENCRYPQTDESKYKLPLKQFSYKVFKNDDYLKHKGKVGSWKALEGKVGLYANQTFILPNNVVECNNILNEQGLSRTYCDFKGKGDRLAKQLYSMRVYASRFLRSDFDRIDYIIHG